MPETRRADVLFFVTLLLGLYLAWQVIDVLLLVYVSILFAVVLSPLIGVVQKLKIGSWRPGRGLAIVIIIFGVLLIAILFIGLAVPPIVQDAQEFASHWPDKAAMIKQKIRGTPFLENFELPPIGQAVGTILGGSLGVVRNLAGGIFSFFYWFILTMYFIVDGERAFHWGLSMFPRNHRDRLERTLIRAELRMRNWLLGQMALMATLGILAMLCFALMGLKYAYALAVFAGVMNLVPILGPITSFALAATVALFDSPWKLLGVTAFYLVYQQIETGFLTPRIMKSTVDLPPLAVIIALSLGGTLAGVLGALVAVPSAALCAVLIDEYLVKHDGPA